MISQTDTPFTPEQLAARRLLAEIEFSRRHFDHFLNHVMVRSDDPQNPRPVKWEQWPYLVDQAKFWESGESEIILKARQLGYSWLAAAYAVWKARRGGAIALISKDQVAARELLYKCRFVEEHLPDYMREKATFKVDDIHYREGYIMAFPSTPDAGVSFTFQVFIFDEAHFHPNAALNYGALTPTISAGGQAIILSTSDPSLGPYGWFPDYYWQSKAGNTGVHARFVPWDARPSRDAAWYETERKKYAHSPEQFFAYYPKADSEAFMGKSGLVFPMFSEERHVKAPLIDLIDCRRVVAGVDLGGGDPTAIVILGMYPNHHVHQYAEFYGRGPIAVDEIAQFLVRYPMIDAIECPPEQATVIETLAKTYQLPAHKANNKRGDGLNLFAMALENDQLSISPECRESIAEFGGYRWAERTDPNDKTRYKTKTPVDNHADSKDATRYALMEILAFMHQPGVKIPYTASNTGRPLARRAI